MPCLHLDADFIPALVKCNVVEAFGYERSRLAWMLVRRHPHAKPLRVRQ